MWLRGKIAGMHHADAGHEQQPARATASVSNNPCFAKKQSFFCSKMGLMGSEPVPQLVKPAAFAVVEAIAGFTVRGACLGGFPMIARRTSPPGTEPVGQVGRLAGVKDPIFSQPDMTLTQRAAAMVADVFRIFARTLGTFQLHGGFLELHVMLVLSGCLNCLDLVIFLPTGQ